ncbi:ATP-binding protein [Streptomyces sp. NPDC054842]
MARRPLPRILSNGSAQIARSRELARTAADSATDVLHPLITITRGLRRLAGAGRRRWAGTPKDRRGPLLFLVASVVLVVALVPYGPLLAVVTLMAAAAWKGREQRSSEPAGPDEPQTKRLQSLYEALVPYFSTTDDPAPLYAHGGEWENAFPSYEFDGTGRVSRLLVRYPAYFTDGEAESRARVEQLLHAKSGRGREYHFVWDEEGNELSVSVLSPLPTDIAAQRFVTAPGETVLGFTDPGDVQRTLPVTHGEEQRDVPPVVWRTGVRSTEPHLLVAGEPGSGTTTLLRSIALQALQHGDVLIVEGGGTGEFACLTGRDGVLAVECGLTGAFTSLEWAAHETERRLVAANRARQAGRPAPDDIRRPLWILLDRPSTLGLLAAADGRKDPQSLLQVPLRHGRAANVTVVVADQFDSLDALSDAVRQHTRARVVLGPASAAQLQAVLGVPPHTTPTPDTPPGRGYARLGSGPVHRLQVPATPDPFDDATSEAQRRAVLALLPERTTPVGPEHLVPGEADADAEMEAELEKKPAVETEKKRPVPVLEPMPTEVAVAES